MVSHEVATMIIVALLVLAAVSAAALMAIPMLEHAARAAPIYEHEEGVRRPADESLFRPTLLPPPFHALAPKVMILKPLHVYSEKRAAHDWAAAYPSPKAKFRGRRYFAWGGKRNSDGPATMLMDTVGMVSTNALGATETVVIQPEVTTVKMPLKNATGVSLDDAVNKSKKWLFWSTW